MESTSARRSRKASGAVLLRRAFCKGAVGLGLTVLLGGAGSMRGEEAPSRVSRKEAIGTAQRYLRHVWKPTAANAFHGIDPNGVRVDTPDAAFQPTDTRPGWWQPGKRNVGLPYMWGGFDTPESFDSALRAGKYAGDIYTEEKRRLLDAAVSKHAAGIDCSGMISRCWKLPRSYSTRELTALCDPVTDLAQLKPGDIFNLHNAHVLLFAGWEDKQHERLSAYEAGSPPTWKVLLNTMPLRFLLDQGYTAWRYRGIHD
jgi:hypothetical protein